MLAVFPTSDAERAKMPSILNVCSNISEPLERPFAVCVRIPSSHIDNRKKSCFSSCNVSSLIVREMVRLSGLFLIVLSLPRRRPLCLCETISFGPYLKAPNDNPNSECKEGNPPVPVIAPFLHSYTIGHFHSHRCRYLLSVRREDRHRLEGKHTSGE